MKYNYHFASNNTGRGILLILALLLKNWSLRGVRGVKLGIALTLPETVHPNIRLTMILLPGDLLDLGL